MKFQDGTNTQPGITRGLYYGQGKYAQLCDVNGLYAQERKYRPVVLDLLQRYGDESGGDYASGRLSGEATAARIQ